MSFLLFDEDSDSPKFQFGITESRATRSGLIPWAQVNSLVTHLFSGEVSRSLPGFPYIRASGLSVVPFGGDEAKISDPIKTDLDADKLNEYEKARVVVEYSSRANGDLGGSSWDGVDPVPLLSHRWSIGGEFVTLDKSGFEWSVNDSSDGGVTQNVKVGRWIATEEHQVTWHRVVNPPFAAIRNALAKVNSEPMQFRTGTADRETVLFLGAELQRDILTDGALAWQLGYRFSERRVPLTEADVTPNGDSMSVGGWNHFYRNSSQIPNEEKTGFYRIRGRSTQDNGGGDPIYPLFDHQDLFVAA